MAKVYEYILKVSDSASPALKRAVKVASGMNTKMDQLNNSLGRYASKLKQTAYKDIPVLESAMNAIGNPFVLATAGVTALTGAVTVGVKNASEYNNEFLELKNLNLDKTQGQIEQLDSTIRNMAFEKGMDPKVISKAFYDVQSATGLYGEEVDKIVSKVANFSMATKADMTESINSTTKAMKAFGLSADDLDNYLASSAKTVQVGITTFDELAKVQTEYAGVASSAGQSVDTANKIFASMTAISKDSATAATATKSALQGLTATNTIKGLESIGISMYDASGQTRNLDEVIRELVPKLQGMSDQQFTTLRNSIGGPEGLQSLFNSLKTSGDDVLQTLNNFDSSKFDLSSALKNTQGDFNTLSGIVQNRLNIVLMELGQMILPHLAVVLDGVGSTIVWLRENTETYIPVLKALGVGLMASATAWGVLTIVSKAYSVAMNISQIATLAMAKGQMILNAVMSANPIGLVIVAIGALVGAMYYAYQKFDWFRGGVWGLWEAFKEAFVSIKDVAVNILGGIGDMIAGVFNGNVDQIKAGAKALGKGLVSATPVGFAMKYGSNLAGAFTKGYNAEMKSAKLEKLNHKVSVSPTTQPVSSSANSLLSAEAPTKSDDNKNGVNSISKGGARQTTINISMGNMIEMIKIEAQEVSEGIEEIEEKVQEVIYRLLTSTANYQNG
ncbi:phage tail tape measure protein [Flammeovirga aprica]|uniref:Phage tail tape measure protein n=1 Tax=Flammeovirga aprica JL-4 TaxID=694437 RepID=A0A7X9RUK9_9BACT|nr:phage tail tape measure protein [Flammeovirga aprica]NME69006.1 phage tail tape measure protein [Flammeovirga aprica JL-4]